jgi:predicted cupin superfamily sugar epimerase/mannose-6-phosphate isomerase-like protein (cupin superfamily)
VGYPIPSHRRGGNRLLAYALLTAGCAVASTVARAADLPAPPGVAGRLIAHFQMKRIPQEGAWFGVTYTSEDLLDGATLPPRSAGRPHAAGGAIVVVVTPRDFSALHRLKTDEVWHFYGGSPLELLLLYPDGRGRTVTLGMNVLGGELAQFTVPKGVWQGGAPISSTARSFSFAGTQMSPGFDSSDFEIGYRDELVRRYPAFAKNIGRLTRAEFIMNAGEPPSRTDASRALSRVFTEEDMPSVSASPGVRLQELIGRAAPFANSSTLSIAKFTLSPGRASATSFNHRSQEVFLVTDGTGEVLLGDKATPVSAESTVFIPAGEVHSIRADPNSTLTFYAVSAPAFSPEDYVVVKTQ